MTVRCPRTAPSGTAGVAPVVPFSGTVTRATIRAGSTPEPESLSATQTGWTGWDREEKEPGPRVLRDLFLTLANQPFPGVNGVWNRCPHGVAVALGRASVDVAGEVGDLHGVVELVGDERRLLRGVLGTAWPM